MLSSILLSFLCLKRFIRIDYENKYFELFKNKSLIFPSKNVQKYYFGSKSDNFK